MSKKKKSKKHRQPNVHPAVRLQNQLEQWVNHERLLKENETVLKQELDSLVGKMKAASALPELLSASFKAPQDIQERLNALFPGWLSERAYLQPLLLLLKQRILQGDLKSRAIQWLNSAGMEAQEIQQLEEQQSLFYQAHLFYNEFQGMITVLWWE